MPDPTRAQDRDRLADAAYVLHGEAGSGTIRRLLYALYLVLIFGGVYGFNLLRAMLVTADQGWVDSLASGWGVLALLATVLVAGTIAVRAGRTRGPVVPQLPYIDTVVTAAIDRALVLRELAAAWLIGAVGTGALIGALVGGAVLGAGRGGVLVIVTAVIGGAMLGLLLAVLALLGQRAASGPGRETSVAGWLRGLRIADLRTHALRTTHIGGAVLAGEHDRRDRMRPDRARRVHLEAGLGHQPPEERRVVEEPCTGVRACRCEIERLQRAGDDHRRDRVAE